MSNQEKIYCGSGKLIDTKYGKVMTVSFSPKDLETLASNKNQKWYVNLNISERKEQWKYGETHTVTINTWQPEKKEESLIPRQSYKPKETLTIQDIPF